MQRLTGPDSGSATTSFIIYAVGVHTALTSRGHGEEHKPTVHGSTSMFIAIRLFWNLAAIGGAIAVGLLTRDAGLTALTFVGGLIVPRMLGLVPHRWGLGRFGAFRGGSCTGWRGVAGGRRERFDDWHRRAHGEPGSQPSGQSTI